VFSTHHGPRIVARFREEALVKLLIKVGGTLIDSAESRYLLALQIAAQAKKGHRTVVVHGGGKQLSRYLQDRGFSSEFRGGLRVTPPEILEAVVRVLAGGVNHDFVADLQQAGARAVGLSGIDSGLVHAVQMSPELGAVGRVDRVDTALLDLLTSHGYVPTVACIAGGRFGAVFNVNADQMAVACAAHYLADRLIFLTDVEGVLDESGARVPQLTPREATLLIERGVAKGGMEAKLRAASAAVAQGIHEVRIVAGSQPKALERVLAGEDIGTALVHDQ
jgi:acetylglutamate kinase